TDLDVNHELISFEICKELGEYLCGLHSIELKQFGYMSEHKDIGVYSSWYQMFELDFNNLVLNQSTFLDKEQYEQTKQIYLSIKIYLIEFNRSVLVHGDIAGDNIRISSSTNGHLNGIIDYGDCLCGDGLYDLGRLLVFVKVEWKYIDDVAHGYKQQETKKWTKNEKECIQFYACYFALWMEVDNVIMEKLLKPIQE
ncbi:unnamed protein product, partial [Didymodactylos carnosus]